MYFKKESGQVVSADFVTGDGFDLNPANHAEYAFPVDGWYWFESLDDAINAFANGPNPQQSITMRQCRLQLLAIGLLDSVDAAIAAIPDAIQRRAAQIEWEYAATVERNSPWVQNLAVALGLNDAQLDSLFAEAAKL